MKVLAYLLLLGRAMAEEETPPVACAGDAITESDCSRTITTSGVIFSYWVVLEGKIPTLHGHFEIEDAAKDLDGSKTYEELRLCLEIGKAGTEYEWREQI